MDVAAADFLAAASNSYLLRRVTVLKISIDNERE
jgi:hypothetical protein